MLFVVGKVRMVVLEMLLVRVSREAIDREGDVLEDEEGEMLGGEFVEAALVLL